MLVFTCFDWLPVCCPNPNYNSVKGDNAEEVERGCDIIQKSHDIIIIFPSDKSRISLADVCIN